MSTPIVLKFILMGQKIMTGLKEDLLYMIYLLKDKYRNFEVGLKCILMVNPYLLVCSYIK